MKVRSLPLAWVAAVLLLLLTLLAFAELSIGAMHFSVDTLLHALFHYQPTVFSDRIIVDIRLLHLIVAAVVGACLAMAGYLLQTIIGNPLGEPHIFGLNAGASLAVVACSAFGNALLLSPFLRPLIAAIGGGALFSAVLFAAYLSRQGLAVVTTTLCGITLSAFAASLTSLLLLFNEQTLQATLLWLNGDIAGLNWSAVYATLPPFLLAVVVAFLVSPALCVLSLGEQVAEGLGVRVLRSRIIGLGAIALFCGIAVSLAGPIGFVGLIVPNIVRQLITVQPRSALWVNALMGAVLLLVADLCAQHLLGSQSLATGTVTALLGAPVFVALAVRYFR
ncbi:FecCD family ABC transporter permease [Rosenbergiella collisarenosi]|uniref:FecCD family ABC transporter permease n=1 Tax=Rosenbergiella collisarenosi TaxID=1544695 RepID=UPI001BD9E59C|nr:iron ABC transporter permease [Rosenbergiella collisarenosi]MBT0720323.1 iron ABC transporter permease [Rosenbergiella collisarenosi]